MADDIDGLITCNQVASLSTIPSTTMIYTFTIHDGGDVSKARTQTFEFGIRLTSTIVGLSYVWEKKRTLVYTNPCLISSLFNSPLTIPNIEHTPGVYTEKSTNLQSYFPITYSSTVCSPVL